jgi:hypothetical protein
MDGLLRVAACVLLAASAQSGSAAAVSSGIDITTQLATIKATGVRLILLAVWQTQGAEVWDAVSRSSHCSAEQLVSFHLKSLLLLLLRSWRGLAWLVRPICIWA